MYVCMYICINNSEIKIYKKLLFRKLKITLPNVESFNVIS